GNQESIYNFYHHLDGRGYSISGGDKTLFEVLEGDAVVQNLSVDADISDSNSGVGVLAGVMKDDARVENVQTSGSIDITCGPGSTCRDVGGIVGAMNHSSYIYRSSASVPL